MTETIREEYQGATFQNNDIIFSGPKGKYWGAITQNNEDFVFPSPVNLPEWLDNTADWLGEGTSILEIGPGKADLASKLLSRKRKTKTYFIADISEEILKFANDRIKTLQGSVKVHVIQGNLNDKDSLHEIKPGSLDRVILVNVIGYLDPAIALNKIYRFLHHGGFLRLTVGDHEFFTNSEDYDPRINLQYVRGRKLHANAGIKPLGYTLSDDGKQVPFYGYRRNYSKEEIKTFLDHNGFAIEQFKAVIIPKELWLKVRSTRVDFKLSRKEQELLEKWGGRPVWDIIARKK